MNGQVLIVGDSPSLQEFLAGVTARLGLQAVHASNGTEALARFAADTPSLVIMGVGLPDTSGFDIVRAIRSAETNGKGMPISFLTGLDSDTALAEGIAVGGDDCLRQVAGILRQAARRPGDLAARYGGEEFVIALPGADRPGAIAMAERVRGKLCRLAIPQACSDVAAHVTASIGIATLTPTEPNAEARTLVKLADDALYRAKAEGRNRWSAASLLLASESRQP